VSSAMAGNDVYVRLRTGEEHYALPVAEALEVIELGTVDAVPGAPAATLGVRAVRGQPLPVFDLAQLIGGAKGAPTQIVVTQHRSGRIGLAVDEVLDVTELPSGHADVDPDAIRSSVLVDGMLVGVLDLDAALGRLGS
jgi:chemotaxis signal transduction protein